MPHPAESGPKSRGATARVYSALAANPGAETPADPTQTPLPRGSQRPGKTALVEPHRLPFGQFWRGLASNRGE